MVKFILTLSLAVFLLPGLARASSCCHCQHCPRAASHSTAKLSHHRHRRHSNGVAHRSRRANDAALRYAESYYNYRSPSTVTQYDASDEVASGLTLTDMRDFDGGVGYGTDGFSGTYNYSVWFEGAGTWSFRRDRERRAFHHGWHRPHHRPMHGGRHH
jgi:hypothetical protein